PEVGRARHGPEAGLETVTIRVSLHGHGAPRVLQPEMDHLARGSRGSIPEDGRNDHTEPDPVRPHRLPLFQRGRATKGERPPEHGVEGKLRPALSARWCCGRI